MFTVAGAGASKLRRDSSAEIEESALLADPCSRAATGVRSFGGAMAVGGTALVALPAVGPLCPLRRTTGVPCPVCGMTTGTFAMVRGDFVAAFLANPLAPLLFAVVLLAFIPPLWRQLWRGLKAIKFSLDAPDESGRSRWWVTIPIVFGLWFYQLHRFDHI